MDKEIKKISKYSEQELQLYAQTENIVNLHKIKLYFDDIYYNTGKSSGISDWQYDIIKESLSDRDPNYVVPIGVKIRENENRVKLPYWLGSMEKMSVQSAILYYYKDLENCKTKNLTTEKVEKMWDKLSENEKGKYSKLAVSSFEKRVSYLDIS